jgi:hypothetical protein
MNYFTTSLFNPAIAIAIASTFFLASSCSSAGKLGTPMMHKQGHPDREQGGGPMPHHGSDSTMPHRGKHNALQSTHLQLVVPPDIKPNTPFSLVLKIVDASGQPISNFETFHEKLLHLIIVSDNLSTFQHIHPEYQQNGQFEVTTSLPTPGQYTLFADYKPAGSQQRVSVSTVSVPGTEEAAPSAQFNTEKLVENAVVTLTRPKSALKVGEDTMLEFELKDATSKAPIALQPYLGELGHLVIIHNTQTLTEENYIHAHAMPNTPTGTVAFHTRFPRAGLYKMWGQFNREGKIITADFWVNVTESSQ